MNFKIKSLTISIVLGLIILYISFLLFALLFNEYVDISLLNIFLQIFSNSLVIYIITKKVEHSDIEMKYILGDMNLKTIAWVKLIFTTLLLLLFDITTVTTVMTLRQTNNPDYLFELLLTPLENDSTFFIYKVLLFLVLIILAPIAEELYFRGYLLNKLSSKKNLACAIIFSSLLFSILHINSFILPQFFGGIFYSLVYIKTRKLIIPIILHSLHNFISGIHILFPGNELTVADLPPIQFLETIFFMGTLLFLLLLPIIYLLFKAEFKKIIKIAPYYYNKELM